MALSKPKKRTVLSRRLKNYLLKVKQLKFLHTIFLKLICFYAIIMSQLQLDDKRFYFNETNYDSEINNKKS